MFIIPPGKAERFVHAALRIYKQKRARDGGRVSYTPPHIYVWV
jgi:hypothetical protein